jgi:hypothetical protein
MIAVSPIFKIISSNALCINFTTIRSFIAWRSHSCACVANAPRAHRFHGLRMLRGDNYVWIFRGSTLASAFCPYSIVICVTPSGRNHQVYHFFTRGQLGSELATIFVRINSFHRSANDLRSLASILLPKSFWVFHFNDVEHGPKIQFLKLQPVRLDVVCRDGLRIAIDVDGRVAQRTQFPEASDRAGLKIQPVRLVVTVSRRSVLCARRHSHCI